MATYIIDVELSIDDKSIDKCNVKHYRPVIYLYAYYHNIHQYQVPLCHFVTHDIQSIPACLTSVIQTSELDVRYFREFLKKSYNFR